ncbi:MAG: hypothetical protein ACJ76D_00805 [Solirubrobacterales bacterium]
MPRRILLPGLSLACYLAIAAPAPGLVVSDVVQGSAPVAGSACGGRGTATVRMPSRTRSVRVANPSVGGPVYSHGHVVARVDARTVASDAKGLFAQFTVHGSDDVCAHPTSYPSGWAGYIDYNIDIRRRVQVYAPTRCLRRARARPKAIFVTCTGAPGARVRLVHLRWRTWGGKVARGRGVLSVNDCAPSCGAASDNRYRVKVKLSKAVDCGRWWYTRLRVRFIGRQPAGSRHWSLPLNCPS